MNVVNLLPFEVAIFTSEKKDSFVVFPPSKAPATIEFDEYCVGYVNEFPVKKAMNKKVINLPDPENGTVYLVPKTVAIFCNDRLDLVVPYEPEVNKDKKVAYTCLKKY